MSKPVAPLTQYYLLYSPYDFYFLCDDSEIDKNLENNCVLISQSFVLTNILKQGFDKAKEAGVFWKGYNPPKEAIKNPVKLKFNSK